MGRNASELVDEALAHADECGVLPRFVGMQSVKDWDRSRLGYRFVKRAFDICFSGCVLAVIAVPSLVLAAAIRAESEGNPFYGQVRVGHTHRDGSLSTFRMWKFRSMYKDADERLKDLLDQNEVAGAMFKMKNDPRVTRIGRFIRKHSIDEFPQFLNVFLGDMSVVGPRPPFRARSASTRAMTCGVSLSSPASRAFGRSRTAITSASMRWSLSISSTLPRGRYSSTSN